MDRVQELIDERRSELPTGLAKELLELCKEANDESEHLYHVSCIRIVANGYLNPDCENCVDMKPITQRHLLKVKARPAGPGYKNDQEWIDMGFLEKEWLDWTLPKTLEQTDGCLTIVFQISRRVPKRMRDTPF
jgi:hypothetical protein